MSSPEFLYEVPLQASQALAGNMASAQREGKSWKPNEQPQGAYLWVAMSGAYVETNNKLHFGGVEILAPHGNAVAPEK
uniref:Uncharacterized protein n=1 Tax=Sphaerodactylus townsendi TaxID=933632 RepID=A0ACB8G5N7_9SAUR